MRAVHDRVKAFVKEHTISTDAGSRLLDLVSEVGELAKEHLSSSAYGKEDFRPTEAWEGEIGDVVFSLVCLANETDVDLDAALTRALEKYERRLHDKGDAGSTESRFL